MDTVSPTEHYLIGRYRWMLEAYGHTLTKETRILDFCCGSGGMVRTFRNAGYDCVGFEPFAEFAPRGPEFQTWGLTDLTTPVDWNWRLPYPNDDFDFVFSQEVMEHVSDHEAVIAELRRITKPNGAQIHTFPGPWQLIEPHIKVPLGGLIKSFAWFYLWDLLGWRYENMADKPRRERVRHQLRYARTSLNYREPLLLKRMGRRYFAVSRYIPKLWERGGTKRIRPWLYTRTRHAVWLLSRPYQTPP